MIPFVLLIALVDFFAEEFGTAGTPFWLVLPTLFISGYGFYKGTQLTVRVCDDIEHRRQAPRLAGLARHDLVFGRSNFWSWSWLSEATGAPTIFPCWLRRLPSWSCPTEGTQKSEGTDFSKGSLYAVEALAVSIRRLSSTIRSM
jgi:hypothetical protein